MPTRRLALVLIVCLAGFAPGLLAWGPHSEITTAALDVLPQRERLKKYLGDDFDRLAKDYVWTGDWREGVRPDHYAEDYLLFPGAPEHVSHLLPEVRQTYAPFFRRALQAVRTESPREAARWVGSLLHFVQDSGSPPHTTGITGDLHTKMENWLDAKAVKLPGYEPRLLGKTDDEALRGFLDRMDGMIEFSKARALKLKPLLERLEQRENQPLELECALEVARVTADVVHTLFALGLEDPSRPGGTLEGESEYRPPAGYATVPAKVVLAGTSFSTTTASDGGFRFRNLPPGRYVPWVLATGYETLQADVVEVKAGETVRITPKLTPDSVAGNLVRNPRCRLEWVKAGRPDGWTRDPVKGGRWASAVIRVPAERKCVVRVEFVPGKQTPVAVRWRTNPATTGGSRETALDPESRDAKDRLTAEVAWDRSLTPFEKGVLYLEVLLQTEAHPAAVCRHVSVVFAE